MPEEHNRKLTDHLSSLLLAHSAGALDNLARESIPASRVHLVGNTMIDSLHAHLPAARARAPWAAHDVEPGEFVLVTLHRPALVDDDALLTRTVNALAGVAAWRPVVFAVHPRTHGHLERLGLVPLLRRAGVRVCGPLGYFEFLGMEAAAAAVVTDSGGVQEETSALGVPCFTLRSSTERPITVELGTNTLLGLAPERLTEIPALLAGLREAQPIPLWDGAAGARAADVLLQALS